MKKGEIYEGIVECIDFPNKGIVTVDGVEESHGLHHHKEKHNDEA